MLSNDPMMYKFPMAIVGYPKIYYIRLTGMVSHYAHHRAFVIEDEDKCIVIWSVFIVKGKDGKGTSWCYCSDLKQAVDLVVNDTYGTLMLHNIPPKFPAIMYDHDLSMMSYDELLEFLLNFEYFDIVDHRGVNHD